jgi:hypothetical protein
MRLDVYRDDRYLGGYHIGDASEVRIGRDRRNAIILPHTTVSRHHANLPEPRSISVPFALY